MKTRRWREAGGVALMMLGAVLLISGVVGANVEQAGERGEALLLIFLGGGALFWGYRLAYRIAPLLDFNERVSSLEPFVGRPRDEVRKRMGRPAASEQATGGHEKMSWSVPGVHLTCSFQDGVCTAVARRTET